MATDTGIWTSGESYERYVGRWSRPVAGELLAWLDLPAGLRWLDIGCGTGALTGAVLQAADPASITAIDRSAGYAAHAARGLTDPRVRFGVADAAALPFADGAYDAAVSGLVLNFVPDPGRAVAEAARVTTGPVAMYVWDYADRMDLMRYFWDAAGELDPRVRAIEEGARFPLCRPEPLAALFATALHQVEVRAIDVPTPFRDFDDYWTPFLGGQGPAPAYAMSLPPADRDHLRDLLRDRLPVAADGTVTLTARAWAARGTSTGAR